ncbi:hypothetical protein [Lysinibacillus xylanilyticus]|uniref:hypothetical protein n=1 Tax=Lysinibacillus xylanilyticus TaxID=582475 RepID=UPI003802405B
MKDVLRIVEIPEATYHYHIQQLKNEDPNQEWKTLVLALFESMKVDMVIAESYSGYHFDSCRVTREIH